MPMVCMFDEDVAAAGAAKDMGRRNVVMKAVNAHWAQPPRDRSVAWDGGGG
jgi:hypothetical protein